MQQTVHKFLFPSSAAPIPQGWDGYPGRFGGDLGRLPWPLLPVPRCPGATALHGHPTWVILWCLVRASPPPSCDKDCTIFMCQSCPHQEQHGILSHVPREGPAPLCAELAQATFQEFQLLVCIYPKPRVKPHRELHLSAHRSGSPEGFKHVCHRKKRQLLILIRNSLAELK